MKAEEMWRTTQGMREKNYAAFKKIFAADYKWLLEGMFAQALKGKDTYHFDVSRYKPDDQMWFMRWLREDGYCAQYHMSGAIVVSWKGDQISAEIQL